MRKVLLALLFIVFSKAMIAQLCHRELAGFALGQWKTIPSSVLGNPYLTDTTSIGINYEAFHHPISENAVIVFEYSEDKKPTINSIHFSIMQSSEEAGFMGLKFGMDAPTIKKKIGVPSDIISIGEYGFRWDYENSNFFLELDQNNKLWGIKIFEPSSNNLPSQNGNVVPSIQPFLQAAKAGSNESLLDFLAPNLQVISFQKTYFFLNAWNIEKEFDKSPILGEIRNAANKTTFIDTLNLKAFKQSLIPTTNGIPKYQQIIKQSSPFKELHWEYLGGKYRLVFIRID
jgi:hypothetical protein